MGPRGSPSAKHAHRLGRPATRPAQPILLLFVEPVGQMILHSAAHQNLVGRLFSCDWCRGVHSAQELDRIRVAMQGGFGSHVQIRMECGILATPSGAMGRGSLCDWFFCGWRRARSSLTFCHDSCPDPPARRSWQPKRRNLGGAVRPGGTARSLHRLRRVADG